MIKFLFITNNPEIARYAVDCGCERIFVDLESIGKDERQGHRDTLMSSHCLADVELIRKAVPDAELLVRVNPINPRTRFEAQTAIASGADLLMLPMFRTADDVRTLVDAAGGGRIVVPLVETPQAMDRLDSVLEVEGVAEIFIGLNDLHLAMGLDFMFEIVSSGLVDLMAAKVRRTGLPFGFGGIARVREGLVSGATVLTEHLRMGSSSVILSRTFHGRAMSVRELRDRIDLKDDISQLREAESRLARRNAQEVEADRLAFCDAVDRVVCGMRAKAQ